VRRATLSEVLPSMVLKVPSLLMPVTRPTWDLPSCFHTAMSPTRSPSGLAAAWSALMKRPFSLPQSRIPCTELWWPNGEPPVFSNDLETKSAHQACQAPLE
jgi:hypothetical protein